VVERQRGERAADLRSAERDRDAIAAGNHAYLKPSEHTPRTALWVRELLADVFPGDRVAVALGGP
jgi:hypothetical protein